MCAMTWEQDLRESICDLPQLAEYIELTPNKVKRLREVIDRHPMRITRYYLSLIDGNDPSDPIARMAVPSEDELDLAGSYDTSGERQNAKLPGLQHMYPQTALILVTNECATYCRHCFRRRMVGLPTEEILRGFDDVVRYIEEHKEVDNAFMTGGDPFVLPTGVIGEFLEKLSTIPHLGFIRFGTRVPVTLPDRILEDDELLALLESHSSSIKRIRLITQFNHPREITPKAVEAVLSLIRSAVAVSNQTVLLKGVNDAPEVLAELQSSLVNIGVSPYYVFQCRPVTGVKNRFQVPLCRGYEVVENAKRMLNGPSKGFRYVMSHQSGKIETVGVAGDHVYFRYHQARVPRNAGKFFRKKMDETAGWLDDLK